MSKLKLITFVLRMVLAVIVMIVSSISIGMGMGDVWICVFCLALLNLIDLSEKDL